jgi:hypothetical protein
MPFFGPLLLMVTLLALFASAVWLIVKGQRQNRSYSDRDSFPPGV